MTSSNESSFDFLEENLILGAIGAIFGAVIDLFLLIFCSYFGVVPGLVSFLMCFLTIKGYTFFSGCIGRKGLIITAVISIIAILMSEFGVALINIYFDWNKQNPDLFLKYLSIFISKNWKRMIYNTLLSLASYNMSFAITCYPLWVILKDGPKKNVKVESLPINRPPGCIKWGQSKKGDAFLSFPIYFWMFVLILGFALGYFGFNTSM